MTSLPDNAVQGFTVDRTRRLWGGVAMPFPDVPAVRRRSGTQILIKELLRGSVAALVLVMASTAVRDHQEVMDDGNYFAFPPANQDAA